MTSKERISAKNEDILDANFEIIDITKVPESDDRRLKPGKVGLRFKATVLFIDLIGSAALQNKHNIKDVSKILMAYYNTICSTASEFGGMVRSFNGDSLLAFFPDCSVDGINNAVKAALVMKYRISQGIDCLNNLIKAKNESVLDYGIGIDHGEILCTKTEILSEGNGDVVWLSDCINKASRISQTRKSIHNIGISSVVENVLKDDLKVRVSENLLGTEQMTEIWSPSGFIYGRNNITYYFTSYFWREE